MDEKKKKILCVDDNTNLCRTLSLVLKRKGYDVEMAKDGREALEKWKGSDFEMTLLDIKLPGPNGVETLKKIKEMKKDARVIMMTAYAIDDMVSEAIDSGAEGVFYKPMDMDEVISKIEKDNGVDESPENKEEVIV